MRNIYNFVVATLVCSTALFLINVNASLAYDQAKSVSAKDPSTTYNHYSLSGNHASAGADETRKVIDAPLRGDPIKPTHSANAGKKDARVAIDLNNICRWVDKSPSNVKNQDLFVPFQTDEEWVAFVNNAPKDIVTLKKCARQVVAVPANDQKGSDANMRCYNKGGTLLSATATFKGPFYGRAGYSHTKAITPTSSVVFKECYTLDHTGPFSKQVVQILSMTAFDADRPGGSTSNRNNSDWLATSVTYTTPTASCGTANNANLSTKPSTSTQLCSYGVASAVGGTGPWTWTCRGLKNKASCMANKKVDGSCGSADGKSLTTAPTVAERCTAGSASALSGSGPWTWACNGLNGGSNDSCSAEKTNPTCPPVSVFGPSHPVVGNIAQPLNDGYMYVKVSGSYHGKAESNYKKSWDSYNSKWAYHSWASGKCYWPNFMLSGGNYNERWVNCIVTDYVKTKVNGYSDMTGSCTVDTDNYLSPLKVNLAERNPSMNSTRPTTFYLTLADGRIMEGKATGGLNPDEGWLMVHRTRDPLVFKNGALNADNWFGDRDGRSLNGFTDLAETFSNFIETDENGQRFIPLNVLTKEQKQEKAEYAAKNPGQITDPSFDLRVVDARNAERFASDYFSRIYVDYRNVVEADSKDGQIKGSNNIILERGIARTVNGRNTEVLDQWFVIDLPADMSPPKGKTKSRILPPARK